MSYKIQIETELNKQNWEITEIDANHDWWDDEHWKVQLKFNNTIFFHLCFIVDPMFEGNRKKGQGIHEIKAITTFPKNWNDDEHLIASIQMSKGKFDVKLLEFIENIERHFQDKK